MTPLAVKLFFGGLLLTATLLFACQLILFVRTLSHDAYFSSTLTRVPAPSSAVDIAERRRRILHEYEVAGGWNSADCNKTADFGLIAREESDLEHVCLPTVHHRSRVQCSNTQNEKHPLITIENIAIDFRRVSRIRKGADWLSRFYNFHGSVLLDCNVSAEHVRQAMSPFSKHWVRDFTQSWDVGRAKCGLLVDHPVYVAGRYEVWIHVLSEGIHPSDISVVFFDGQPAIHQFTEAWALFSQKMKLSSLEDWRERMVDMKENEHICFSKVLVGTPGYISPMTPNFVDVSRCRGTGLMTSFRNFFMRELDIVPSSPIGNPKIHLTVIYRHDYFSGRWRQVSRKFSNEEHVRQGLDEVVDRYSWANIEHVDVGNWTFQRQVELMSRTDILIGGHGAALTLLAFLPPHAWLLELFPCRQPHFRTLSQLCGLTYYGFPCVGGHGSDSIIVDVGLLKSVTEVALQSLHSLFDNS